MPEHRYDPRAIEPKWQASGSASRRGRSPNDDVDRRAQVLRARDAALPVGRAAHGAPEELRGRRRGRALPPPHGPPRAAPDGLRRVRPAGREPRDQDRRAPARLDREVDRRSSSAQFREWGISIDWSREFGTHEPRYYRWTQWLFLRCLERGLAYRKEAAVNWCPKDATVLANEQVIDGRCERCGTPVEARQLEQWFFRITDYADRLLDDLDDHRLARARRDDAAQLDRALRGRRGHVHAARSSASTTRSSPRARTRCSARRSS